ncbi:hypothetical protein FIV00_03640 [Labrenzia sp. THAF82]|nr:hypothetical protein FIV00_03640 [Labrenzia sp. THAF82]
MVSIYSNPPSQISDHSRPARRKAFSFPNVGKIISGCVRFFGRRVTFFRRSSTPLPIETAQGRARLLPQIRQTYPNFQWSQPLPGNPEPTEMATCSQATSNTFK